MKRYFLAILSFVFIFNTAHSGVVRQNNIRGARDFLGYPADSRAIDILVKGGLSEAEAYAVALMPLPYLTDGSARSRAIEWAKNSVFKEKNKLGMISFALKEHATLVLPGVEEARIRELVQDPEFPPLAEISKNPAKITEFFEAWERKRTAAASAPTGPAAAGTDTPEVVRPVTPLHARDASAGSAKGDDVSSVSDGTDASTVYDSTTPHQTPAATIDTLSPGTPASDGSDTDDSGISVGRGSPPQSPISTSSPDAGDAAVGTPPIVVSDTGITTVHTPAATERRVARNLLAAAHVRPGTAAAAMDSPDDRARGAAISPAGSLEQDTPIRSTRLTPTDGSPLVAGSASKYAIVAKRAMKRDLITRVRQWIALKYSAISAAGTEAIPENVFGTIDKVVAGLADTKKAIDLWYAIAKADLTDLLRDPGAVLSRDHLNEAHIVLGASDVEGIDLRLESANMHARRRAAIQSLFEKFQAQQNGVILNPAVLGAIEQKAIKAWGWTSERVAGIIGKEEWAVLTTLAFMPTLDISGTAAAGYSKEAAEEQTRAADRREAVKTYMQSLQATSKVVITEEIKDRILRAAQYAVGRTPSEIMYILEQHGMEALTALTPAALEHLFRAPGASDTSAAPSAPPAKTSLEAELEMSQARSATATQWVRNKIETEGKTILPDQVDILERVLSAAAMQANMTPTEVNTILNRYTLANLWAEYTRLGQALLTMLFPPMHPEGEDATRAGAGRRATSPTDMEDKAFKSAGEAVARDTAADGVVKVPTNYMTVSRSEADDLEVALVESLQYQGSAALVSNAASATEGLLAGMQHPTPSAPLAPVTTVAAATDAGSGEDDLARAIAASLAQNNGASHNIAPSGTIDEDPREDPIQVVIRGVVDGLVRSTNGASDTEGTPPTQLEAARMTSTDDVTNEGLLPLPPASALGRRTPPVTGFGEDA